MHDANNALAVDPGEAAPLQKALTEYSLQLQAVLITHHHADHQGGLPNLLRDNPRLDIYAPRLEPVNRRSIELSGDETIQLKCMGEESLYVQVLSVAGHTRGHLAYYVRTEQVLFCGDTLFGGGCGRLFEGTAQQMFDSLTKIAALPDNTRIYCAHEYTENNLAFAQAIEPDNTAIVERLAAVETTTANGHPSLPSTLQLEKATNPFLRCRQPAVIAAACKLEPSVDKDNPVAVFAALRARRDTW